MWEPQKLDSTLGQRQHTHAHTWGTSHLGGLQEPTLRVEQPREASAYSLGPTQHRPGP